MYLSITLIHSSPHRFLKCCASAKSCGKEGRTVKITAWKMNKAVTLSKKCHNNWLGCSRSRKKDSLHQTTSWSSNSGAVVVCLPTHRLMGDNHSRKLNGVTIVCRVGCKLEKNVAETVRNACLARTALRMRPLRLAKALQHRCAPLQAPPLVRSRHLWEGHKIRM